METLSIVYWSRVGLGVVAALMSVLYNFFLERNGSLLTGLSIAMALYLLTYYIFKQRFVARVENPSKVFTTGIGAYFIVWVVAWTLFYTIMLSLLGLLPTG